MNLLFDHDVRFRLGGAPLEVLCQSGWTNSAVANFFIDCQVIVPRRAKGIEHACR